MNKIGAMTNHPPSMLSDVRNQSPTEVDFLSGAIAREAARSNVPAPLHTVTDDLHLLVTGSQMFEQHWPLLVQASSATLHTTPVPPEPGVPTGLSLLPSVACASLGVP